ncbi:acyl-CoA dehydrogenase family protein [Thalassobacillus sp. CUG 92003]|uniref:acyl-CoA dehydrogenase family protein n=1 Tax=Thalassobacillus sp. CUG 92003 TaxID=2736641 RepID=UPI0015E64B8E
MTDLLKKWVKTEDQQRLFSKAERLAEKAGEVAAQSDKEASFSFELLHEMKKEKYPSLTLPANYGGENISLYTFLLLQEKLAEGDGSAALSIGWHLGVVMELKDDQPWEDTDFVRLANEIKANQVIVNRAASEPATGSPTRGGIPETKAVRQGEGYVLNGRKTFTSMAEQLDYFIVSAYVEELDTVGWFLIHRDLSGVKVEKTWDTLGMRGTGSDDLVLENVKLPERDLVEMKGSQKPSPKGWLLHIPACYLGIALAARNKAITFAQNFQPNSLNTTISEVSHIREKIGEMDLKLIEAHHFLYSVAQKWDEQPVKRTEMAGDLAAVKVSVTNKAQEIVDLAMRVAGGRGLSKQYQFEKYYRDVRAGLHNPPMDDAVLQILAGNALDG